MVIVPEMKWWVESLIVACDAQRREGVHSGEVAYLRGAQDALRLLTGSMPAGLRDVYQKHIDSIVGTVE